jgi:hypothetical protein
MKQAQRCETAKTPRCRCRCGGLLHGAARGKSAEGDNAEFFESLPDDDPHKAMERPKPKPRQRKPKPLPLLDSVSPI